jgi:hypothetical protein
MHRHPGFARYLIAALLLAAAWLLPGAAAAQGDTTSLQVGAVLCQDAACIDHGNLVPGFTITALDSATGDILATCTTDAAEPHTCTLELPAGADWILDWDQAPDGYTWRGDLYPVADGPFGSATLIPFVPAQETEPTVAPTAPVVIEEPGHVTIQAALCTDATCNQFAQLLDGFTFSAVDPDTGEVFSSCATNNPQQGLAHQCMLDVPGEGAWDVTWDASQVPAGYTYVGQPITTGEPAVMTIAFAPAAQPTETATATETATPATTPTQAAVTALPTTGTGPGGGMHLPVLQLIAGVVLAALALAARPHRLASARLRNR